MNEYLDLFGTFAKVGVMTFGGGYAMLPILQREVVEHKGWATEEELMDYFAIGQCTPGVIAVNTATFIGQKHRGWLGGIVATLGVVFPSLVIISILAGLITNFSHLAWVQNAFAGIQVCVCVLIFNAVLKLLKKSVVDKRTAAIFLIVMAGSLFLHISPNILGTLSVLFATRIAGNVISVASMSYLGLGLQPPTPDWGVMINDARQYFRQEPLLVIAPGLCILLLSLSINLLADELRDRLDVRKDVMKTM